MKEIAKKKDYNKKTKHYFLHHEPVWDRFYLLFIVRTAKHILVHKFSQAIIRLRVYAIYENNKKNDDNDDEPFLFVSQSCLWNHMVELKQVCQNK
jgi:hypothetical protein